jgi:ribosomal protein S2
MNNFKNNFIKQFKQLKLIIKKINKLMINLKRDNYVLQRNLRKKFKKNDQSNFNLLKDNKNKKKISFFLYNNFNILVVLDINFLLKFGFHLSIEKKFLLNIMKSFIFCFYNKYLIINLNYFLLHFKRLSYFLYNLLIKNGKLLFISNNLYFDYLIKKIAYSVKHYYIIYRWIGGLFTNFNEIKKWIYILYNRIPLSLLTPYHKTLKLSFDGIRFMRRIPQCVIIISPINLFWCVSECNILKLPIISLCNLNNTASGLTYFLPSNNNTPEQAKFYLLLLKEIILLARFRKLLLRKFRRFKKFFRYSLNDKYLFLNFLKTKYIISFLFNLNKFDKIDFSKEEEDSKKKRVLLGSFIKVKKNKGKKSKY